MMASTLSTHPKVMAVLVVALIGTSAAGFGYAGITTVNDQGVRNQLQQSYQQLESAYASLNTSYYTLLAQYTALMATYDLLSGNYTVLNATYWQLVMDYNNLQSQYTQLQSQYAQSQSQLSTLAQSYANLQSLYNNLMSQYNTLQVQYDELETTWNLYLNLLSQTNLIYRVCLYDEAVRRGEFDYKAFDWLSYTKFMAKIILHDTNQYNYFSYYDNLFKELFVDESRQPYGGLTYPYNNTAYLSWFMLYSILASSVFNQYYGTGYTNIRTVHDWVRGLLDYEYDDVFWLGYTEYPSDYPKFPVETGLRTMGDCEDQAMFDAACLESNGYETAIATIHDPVGPYGNGFYHGFLFVKLGETESQAIATLNSWGMYSGYLWSLSGSDYVWRIFDPTWDTPAGQQPEWCAYNGYEGTSAFQSNFNFAIVSQSWLGLGSGSPGDNFAISCIEV